MRIDIEECTDIELLRREAFRLESVIEANVNRAEDEALKVAEDRVVKLREFLAELYVNCHEMSLSEIESSIKQALTINHNKVR